MLTQGSCGLDVVGIERRRGERLTRSSLLGRELRGIQLSQYKVEHFDDLDSPLVHIKTDLGDFVAEGAPFGAASASTPSMPSRAPVAGACTA